MENKYFFSIIIPVYNVEKFLKTCIESVLNQTYKNYEIILIDDGSTDCSGKICDLYKKKNNKIKVFHNKNQGASLCRNIGIDNSIGKYILFLDSDDYIREDCLEKCKSIIEQKQSEIVMFGYNKVDIGNNLIFSQPPKSSKDYYYDNEICDYLLPKMLYEKNKKKYIHLGFNRMCVISKKLINENRWKFESERNVISEDVYSLLLLYINAKSISIIYDCLYNYRFTPNSISTKYNENALNLNINMYKMLKKNKKIKSKYEIMGNIEKKILTYLLTNIKILSKLNFKYSFKKSKIKEISSNKIVIDLINKHMSEYNFAQKIFFLCLKNRLYFVLILISRIKR